MNNCCYGKFGKLRENYATARQEYPQEVLDFFVGLVSDKNSYVLDLGCGTGISTRQLAKKVNKIIGSDNDELMIEKARSVKDRIEYIVASAEKLPFSGNYFDAVTAFGAFHWFSNSSAILQIKKVLKKRGLFFVVNKNDIGDFKLGFKEILKEVLKSDLPEIKRDYAPENSLAKNGFTDIKIRNFMTSEYFDLSQVLKYFQSLSVWNLVPENSRSEVLNLLKNYCLSRIVDGKIERKINIKVVTGRI